MLRYLNINIYQITIYIYRYIWSRFGRLCPPLYTYINTHHGHLHPFLPSDLRCFVLSIAAMLSLTLEFCGVRTLPGRCQNALSTKGFGSLPHANNWWLWWWVGRITSRYMKATVLDLQLNLKTVWLDLRVLLFVDFWVFWGFCASAENQNRLIRYVCVLQLVGNMS